MSDLGKEQQERLAQAATEAMANLSTVIPPLMAQFQAMFSAALPVLQKSMEPFMLALKELELDRLQPGELHDLIRGGDDGQG